MRKILFLSVALLFVRTANADNYDMQIQMLDNQIARLNAEISEKEAEIGKCTRSTNDLRLATGIAGIATVGLGAVNVMQAKKKKSLDNKISMEEARAEKEKGLVESKNICEKDLMPGYGCVLKGEKYEPRETAALPKEEKKDQGEKSSLAVVRTGPSDECRETEAKRRELEAQLKKIGEISDKLGEETKTIEKQLSVTTSTPEIANLSGMSSAKSDARIYLAGEQENIITELMELNDYLLENCSNERQINP